MARHRKLSKKEVESILNGMHRVLKNRRIDQPIRIQFSTAEPALCWKRQCITLPDGSSECTWVQVPC